MGYFTSPFGTFPSSPESQQSDPCWLTQCWSTTVVFCCCWSQWCAGKNAQFSPQLDKAWRQKDYLWKVLLWNTTEELPCIKAYLCCTTSKSSELKVASKQTKEQTLPWQSAHSNWFAFLVRCGSFYEQCLNLMRNKYPYKDTSLLLDLASYPKCCSVTGK